MPDIYQPQLSVAAQHPFALSLHRILAACAQPSWRIAWQLPGTRPSPLVSAPILVLPLRSCHVHGRTFFGIAC